LLLQLIYFDHGHSVQMRILYYRGGGTGWGLRAGVRPSDAQLRLFPVPTTHAPYYYDIWILDP